MYERIALWDLKLLKNGFDENVSSEKYFHFDFVWRWRHTFFAKIRPSLSALSDLFSFSNYQISFNQITLLFSFSFSFCHCLRGIVQQYYRPVMVTVLLINLINLRASLNISALVQLLFKKRSVMRSGNKVEMCYSCKSLDYLVTADDYHGLNERLTGRAHTKVERVTWQYWNETKRRIRAENNTRYLCWRSMETKLEQFGKFNRDFPSTENLRERLTESRIVKIESQANFQE